MSKPHLITFKNRVINVSNISQFGVGHNKYRQMTRFGAPSLKFPQYSIWVEFTGGEPFVEWYKTKKARDKDYDEFFKIIKKSLRRNLKL